MRRLSAAMIFRDREMAKSVKVGDKVSWTSSGGESTGKVVKKADDADEDQDAQSVRVEGKSGIHRAERQEREEGRA